MTTFAGGGNSNPATDSYTTANGGTYATTNTPSGGDVGANGGVLLNGHAQVGGAIGVVTLTNPSLCNFAQGDYTTQGGQAGPYNTVQYPTNIPQTVCPNPPCAGIVFPTPPDPIPAPPSTPYGGGNTLVPGTYGAITTTSTLTLAPGTYNIYSLNMSGQSSIVVNPPGAVVLNFPSASATPISFAGQSITASSNVANNLQINYGGTGTVALAGKADSVMNVNAPNATVNVSGKGDLYGRVVGSTLNWSGNGKFHFDKASALQPQNNGFYRTVSFREVSY